MTSFVNLMANDIWSEADIVNRTEAMIASEFSAAATAILNRKVTAATIGQYVLTPEEQAEVARYAQVCHDAAAEGIAARADMALLSLALAYEDAKWTVDTAAEDTLALVALRNTFVEPVALLVPEVPVVAEVVAPVPEEKVAPVEVIPAIEAPVDA